MKTNIQAKLSKLAQIKYLSRWIIFTADLTTSTAVTLFTIFFLRYAINLNVDLAMFLRMGTFSIFASILSFAVFQPYKGVVRHSTLQELWRIGLAAVAKSVLLLLLVYMLGSPKPMKFWMMCFFIDTLTTSALLVGLRVTLINIYNFILNNTGKTQRSLLIYGTTPQSITAAALMPHAYLSEYKVGGYLVVGPKGKELSIGGLPVYYVEDKLALTTLMNRNALEGILFVGVNDAKQEQDRLIRYCEKLNLRTLILPPMEELMDGKVRRTVRPVRIEDLLGRDEIKINMSEIGNSLAGKTVMVTGAAGSIGSEICRQLAKFHIKHLVLFDSAETPMHNLRLELEEKFPTLPFTPVIGDVRSETRVDSIFGCYQPNVVFHAAAYKHVPLMESNPCEAIRVNVRGTRNVADMAVKYNVERFVMVSTDKAVNPTNVMGCSKRLAEIYVQSLATALKNGSKQGSTKFITTRFGNVLGSNGSVIPRFREQIANGGPVTVTHPDIIRYFMTIPEACRLVLEAGTMGKGGEIFIFEMGEPVKIANLARRMIELAGFEPDKDIRIEYTGLRPGEKLYEELLSDEENTLPTPHEKIRVAKVREYDYREVEPRIDFLTENARSGKVLDTVRIMKQIVPEFISQNSVYEKFDIKENSEEKKNVKKLII